MRYIMECMHKVSWVKGLAIDDFLHIAELKNIQNNARSVAAKEDDHNAQQHYAQIDLFALPSGRAKSESEIPKK